jgi:integrase
MTHWPKWQRIGVQKVDRPTGLESFGPDPHSAQAPAAQEVAPCQQRRFREAVPEYRVLLSGAAQGSLDRFHDACLHRWSERWAMEYVRSITEENIRCYLAGLVQKGHPEREVRREKGLLQSFYRWACRCGWADQDPTLRLRSLPHLPTPRPTVWTGVEQRRLLEACSVNRPVSTKSGATGTEGKVGGAGQHGNDSQTASSFPPPYLYPLVLVGLRTGLRFGNLLNLEWRHVDFSNNRIVLSAAQVKTGRPVEVPLSVDACWVLRELLRRGQLMPRFPKRVFDAVNIPLWKGCPDGRQVQLDLRLARKRARLADGDFHSLRLSFLRNCARAGVPAQAAARFADWEDDEQLADIYRRNSAPRILSQVSWKRPDSSP